MVNFVLHRRARDKVVLQVRRLVRDSGRGRERVTGNGITAARNGSSRPVPRWPMTSSCRFRFAECPTSDHHPVLGDARMRRGVLSQLPVSSLPETITSRPAWNKRRSNAAAARGPLARPNVVTTDYGWIDSARADPNDDDDDESDKENCFVETGLPEDADRDLDSDDRQRRSQRNDEAPETVPRQFSNSPCSMDVDNSDEYVDMRPYGNLETAPAAGRLAQTRYCRSDGPPMLPPHVRRRHQLPLGTIEEATETSTTRSTTDSSELLSSSLNGGSPVDQPEQELDVDGPETIRNSYRSAIGRSLSTPAADDDDDSAGSQTMDTDDNAIQSDSIAGVSMRQRCAGWRFASSRPRLTVVEFCRRRRDTEATKRQRSASLTEDSQSANASFASLAPSTKRLRTSLKVTVDGYTSGSAEITLTTRIKAYLQRFPRHIME